MHNIVSEWALSHPSCLSVARGLYSGDNILAGTPRVDRIGAVTIRGCDPLIPVSMLVYSWKRVPPLSHIALIDPIVRGVVAALAVTTE